MKKIALITDSYKPVRNGVAIAVEQLRDYLTATGYEVAIVAPAGQAAPSMGGTEFLLPSFRLPGIHPYVAIGRGFHSCLNALRRFRPNVVHVHGWGPVSLLGIHFARSTATPLVITWHTDVKAYLEYYRFMKPLLIFWHQVARMICSSPDLGRQANTSDSFTVALLSTADLVVAPSYKIAKKLRELPLDTPIRIVPVGVDPVVPSVYSSESTLKIRGPMLLYVGRISPEKGIDLLLDAYDIVRICRPNATLVLAGDYRSGRGIRRRLRRAQNLILTGELGPDDLGNLYARADLFVFPSLTDTQGLVLHEAAHAGLPLVLVDEKLQSLVADKRNTTLCLPDPVALAVALMSTLDRRQHGNWAAQANRVGKALAARHSIERQGAKLTILYHQVLKGYL
ncbi:glycosyltransferase [Actinokineospora sp. NBRC 105648]|uniref:glycosyltransferase n=1 Tax=Actinokineospora sp. NBRC 105648 TaxID=3032206 RepID=UPI0024A5B22A|nr:glycosyltransferase [Actinokineospora sp. NBRC 105648]GLZ37625.1 glycosyl transferase family 1 [Actinokineospora sp. NBRC 105648]